MAFGLFSFEVCDEGLKEEYSMNKIFSAEYDFSCVRQIARTDRFARVLMRVRAEKAWFKHIPLFRIFE